MTDEHRLTQKRLFFLWLPLAIMWIVMAIEQPAITAIVSRLPNPTVELAAFGYAFAFALLIEGPIVQMLSAATAVAKDRVSYKRLMLIMHALGIIITALHLVFCIPSVFRWFSLSVMGLPSQMIEPSYYSFVSMIPWAAAVGYRRLWQGVMIRFGKTKEVPYIMYIRIIAAWLVLAVGYFIKTIPGGVIGGLSLSVGVIAGMVAAWFYTAPVIRDWMPEETEESPAMPIRDMVKFYYPLALTSLITLGVRPLLNFGIARGLFPLESLAIWPVALAYMFIYTSVALSLQEIVIAQQKDSFTMKIITSFVLKVGIILTGLYIIILFTPAWKTWFVTISGLPQELLSFIPLTLSLLAVMPACYTVISFSRGLLVLEHKTNTITMGVSLNVIIMMILINVLTQLIHLAGVYAAAISFITAYICETIFLLFQTRSIRKR